MLYDFLYLRRPRCLEEREKIELSFHTSYPTLRSQHSRRSLYDSLMELNGEMQLLFISHYPERKFLGSSYRPRLERKKQTLEELTEQQARMLLNSGCSPEEIVSCYGPYTVDQLQAFLVPVRKILHTKEEIYSALEDLIHCGKKINVAALKEVYDLDPSLENKIPAYIAWHTMYKRKKITGDWKKGLRIPVDTQGALVADVAEVFGNSYAQNIFGLSIGEIAAHKAHRTMGTYEKKELVGYQGGSILIRGKKNTQKIVDRMLLEYGKFDNIPENEFEKFGLEVIDLTSI